MELLQLESIITTQLKVRVPKLIGSSYPNMSFVNEVSDNTPSFPNVYVHELGSAELGNTIDNSEIHAVRNTVQIEVTTNQTKSDARKVVNACIEAMKTLRYSVVATPVYTKVNNIHRFVIRVRRVVASGDNF